MSRARRDAKREIAKERELARLRAAEEVKAKRKQAAEEERSKRRADYEAKRAAMTPEQRQRSDRYALTLGAMALAAIVGFISWAVVTSDDDESTTVTTHADTFDEWRTTNIGVVNDLAALGGTIAEHAQNFDTVKLGDACQDLGRAAAAARRDPPPGEMRQPWVDAMRAYEDAAAFCEDGTRRLDVEALERFNERLNDGTRLIGEVTAMMSP